MPAPPAIEASLRKDGWLPASAVARALGVQPSTIYRACAEGRMSGRRVGRAWYVKKETVLAYYGNTAEIAKALKERIPAAPKVPEITE
jgi:excisionase family DNA binding protein